MVTAAERLDLAELSAEQIAPLEALMQPGWPEIWKELATSHFVTLLSHGSASAEAARLAVALALGVAQDLGGTQPYIPVGAMLAASAKARRAIELLARRASYREVAAATGLTESRVRQIESEWRRQQIADRQGQLPL